MNPRPDVSVCMITYNHGRFIEAAVASVLSQRGDFSFELVVYDDCSSDDTAEICSRFAAESDGRMRFVRQPTNVGMNRNFRDALGACEGRFIALLEGDDYWCSTEKLQRTLQVLTGNDGVQMVCHAVSLLEAPGGEAGSARSVGLLSAEDSEERQWRPLDWPRLRPATCSLVFRREVLVQLLSSRFSDVVLYDSLVVHAAAEMGEIRYLPEVMAVYRIHPGGAWSGATRLAQHLHMLTSVLVLLEKEVFRDEDVRRWQSTLFDYNVICIADHFSDIGEFNARIDGLSPGCIDRFSQNAWVLRTACGFIVEKNRIHQQALASTSYRLGSKVVGLGAKIARRVGLKR